LQAEAAVAGPHSPAPLAEVEAHLVKGGAAVLEHLSDREDTLRAIEEVLIEDYGFPVSGLAVRCAVCGCITPWQSCPKGCGCWGWLINRFGGFRKNLSPPNPRCSVANALSANRCAGVGP
jgi:hypothetical protein